jgi:SSS family solute:Na+ symporter
VTWGLSRLLPPPALAQLQGTTLSWPVLKASFTAGRRIYLALLAYGLAMAGVAVALGVR